MLSQSADSDARKTDFCPFFSGYEKNHQCTRIDVLYLQKQKRAHSFNLSSSTFKSHREAVPFKKRVQLEHVSVQATEKCEKTIQRPKKISL